jgi:hypothetical protein
VARDDEPIRRKVDIEESIVLEAPISKRYDASHGCFDLPNSIRVINQGN